MTQPDGIFSRILPKIREFIDDKREEWSVTEDQQRLRNQARNYTGAQSAFSWTGFAESMASGAAKGPVEPALPPALTAPDQMITSPSPVPQLDPSQRFAPTAPTDTGNYERIPGVGSQTQEGLDYIRSRGVADYARGVTAETAPPAIDPNDPLSPPLTHRSAPMDNTGVLSGSLDLARFGFSQLAEGVLQGTEARLDGDSQVRKWLAQRGISESVTEKAQLFSVGSLLSRVIQLTGVQSWEDADKALKGHVLNRSEVPHWLNVPDTYNYVKNMDEDESFLDYLADLTEDYGTRPFGQQLITELAIEIAGTKGFGMAGRLAAIKSPRQIQGVTSPAAKGFRPSFDASTLTQQRHLYDDPARIHSPFGAAGEGRILQPGQYDPTVTGPTGGTQTVTGGMFTQGAKGFDLEIPASQAETLPSGPRYVPPIRYFELSIEDGRIQGSIKEVSDNPFNRDWMARNSFTDLRANGRVIIPDDGGPMPMGRIQTARRLLVDELEAINPGAFTTNQRERVLRALDQMDDIEYQHVRESVKPGVPVSDFNYQTFYGKYRKEIDEERTITELWENLDQAKRRLAHYKQYGFSNLYEYPKTPLFKLAGAPNVPSNVPNGPVVFSTRPRQGFQSTILRPGTTTPVSTGTVRMGTRESFTVNYNDFDFGDPIAQRGSISTPTEHRIGTMDFMLKARGADDSFIGRIDDATIEDELKKLADDIQRQYDEAVAARTNIDGTWHKYEAARRDYEDAVTTLANTSDRIQTAEDFGDIIDGKLQQGQTLSQAKIDEYFFLKTISEQITRDRPDLTPGTKNLNKFIPYENEPIPLLQAETSMHPSIQFVGRGEIGDQWPQTEMSQKFIQDMPLTPGEGHSGYRFIQMPVRWVRNDRISEVDPKIQNKEITRENPARDRLARWHTFAHESQLKAGQTELGEGFGGQRQTVPSAPIVHTGPSQYGYGTNISPLKIGRREYPVGEPNPQEWTLVSTTEEQYRNSFINGDFAIFRDVMQSGIGSMGRERLRELEQSALYHNFRNLYEIIPEQLRNIDRLPDSRASTRISDIVEALYPDWEKLGLLTRTKRNVTTMPGTEFARTVEQDIIRVDYDALANHINTNPSPADFALIMQLNRRQDQVPGYTGSIMDMFKPKLTPRGQEAYISTTEEMRILLQALDEGERVGPVISQGNLNSALNQLYQDENWRINRASSVKENAEGVWNKKENPESIFAPKWVVLRSDYDLVQAAERSRLYSSFAYKEARGPITSAADEPVLDGTWWSQADIIDGNLEGHPIGTGRIRGTRMFQGAGNDYNSPGLSARNFVRNSLDDKMDTIEEAKRNVSVKRNALEDASSRYTGPSPEIRKQYDEYQNMMQEILYSPNLASRYTGEPPTSETIGKLLDVDYSSGVDSTYRFKHGPFTEERWYTNNYRQPHPRGGAVRTTGEAASLQPMYTEPASGVRVPQLRGEKPTPGTGPIEGTPAGTTGMLPSGRQSGTNVDYWVRDGKVYTADGRVIEAPPKYHTSIVDNYSKFGGKQVFLRNPDMPYEVSNPAERVMFRKLIEEQIVDAAKAQREATENLSKKPGEPISVKASREHYESLGRIPGTAGKHPDAKNHTPEQEAAIERLIQVMMRTKELRPKIESWYAHQRRIGVARGARVLEQALEQADAGNMPYSDPTFIKRFFGAIKHEEHGMLQFTEGAFEATDIELLYAVVNESGEKVMNKTNAFTSLFNLMDGKMITPSQMKILENIFGAQHADKLVEAFDEIKRQPTVWEHFLSAYMVPRVLKSTIDLSALLRQGLYVAVAHPKSGASASRDMIRSVFSPTNAHEIDDLIRMDPLYQLSQEGWRNPRGAKLFIADIQGGVASGEEQFMSSFLTDLGWLPKGLSKLPGVSLPARGKFARTVERINPIAASERAYTTFLNKLRMDVFKTYAHKIEARYPRNPDGTMSEEALKAYEQAANFINAATGRGNLPRWIAEPGNLALFSPRFQVSRIQLLNYGARSVLSSMKGVSEAVPGVRNIPGIPGVSGMAQSYAGINPAIRKMMLKDSALSILGIGIGTMMLAHGIKAVLPDDWKRSGMSADYEPNPLSPRFAQLRVTLPGGRAVSYDTSGGMAVLIRYSAQVGWGAQKATKTGEIVDKERAETITRFIRSKLHPTVGYAVSAATGSTFAGDPTFPGGMESVDRAVEELASPMIWEELMDIHDELDRVGCGAVPRWGAALGGTIPSFLGIGSNAFHQVLDVQDAMTKRMYPHLERYDDANDNQRAQINAHPLVMEAKKEQEQRNIKSARDVIYADKAAYQKGKEDNLAEFRELYKVFPDPGNTLREAIGDYKFSQARINDIFVDKKADSILYGDRADPLLDQLRDGYHGYKIEISAITGEPDFIQWKLNRQQWVDVGLSLGFAEEEITGRGASRFPPEYGAEANIIMEYEADMEELSPYFELGVGLPNAQKTLLRQAAIIQNPRYLQLLQKWEFKLLPGQRKQDEITRMMWEQNQMRLGPTVTREEILSGLTTR